MDVQLGAIVFDDDMLPGQVIEVAEAEGEVLVLWRDGPTEPVWEDAETVMPTDIPTYVGLAFCDDYDWFAWR